MTRRAKPNVLPFRGPRPPARQPFSDPAPGPLIIQVDPEQLARAVLRELRKNPNGKAAVITRIEKALRQQ